MVPPLSLWPLFFNTGVQDGDGGPVREKVKTPA